MTCEDMSDCVVDELNLGALVVPRCRDDSRKTG